VSEVRLRVLFCVHFERFPLAFFIANTTAFRAEWNKILDGLEPGRSVLQFGSEPLVFEVDAFPLTQTSDHGAEEPEQFALVSRHGGVS